MQRSSPNPPKVAILISGLLRCLEHNRALIESWCRDHAVFICTSRESSQELASLSGTYHAHMVEDDRYDAITEKLLDKVADGWKIKQFFKTSRGFDLIEEYENKNKIRFDAVYKMRTDLWFPTGFALHPARDLWEDNTVFMESDWYFGGARDAAEHCCRFYDRIFDFYYGRYDRYWPLDVDLALRSDFGAGRFERLFFPTEILGSYADKPALRRALAEKRDALAAHAARDGEPLSNLHPIKAPMKFAPEPSFLHHVLAGGYVVRGMQRYAPLHPHRKGHMPPHHLAEIGARLLLREGPLAMLEYLRDARLDASVLAAVAAGIVRLAAPQRPSPVPSHRYVEARALVAEICEVGSTASDDLLQLLENGEVESG